MIADAACLSHEQERSPRKPLAAWLVLGSSLEKAQSSIKSPSPKPMTQPRQIEDQKVGRTGGERHVL
ncbi:MAG: hypothetical protein EA367_05540 [Leptolyngbya sp. DLM2.Bin15]|nr:MAG: hypothetical protein EA367_05540 [Leptolyngbya sp. DLM2.Bin15]